MQLMERVVEERLGMPTCSKGPIRQHAFFKPIDWVRLENREIEPTFKPKVVSEV